MIQKAERIIEAYQKVKPAGCGVIAMDGRAAAGKTTLAEELAVTLGGAVVHMDDFFLPGELRTPERLAAPGGNVHAERFVEEVCLICGGGEAFRYRRLTATEWTITAGGNSDGSGHHRGGGIQPVPRSLVLAV